MSDLTRFKGIENNPDHPEVKDVAPKQLSEGLTADVQLIDVREPDEYSGELGHIPGAVLLPLGQLPERGPQVIDLEKPAVFICRSGGRSTQAGVWALENGAKEVYNMKGGMLAWQKEGLRTE